MTGIWKNGPESHLRTVAQMQAYVNKIVASAWWKQRFPYPTYIEVHPGKRRRNACARGNAIYMPLWSRTEFVILHEMAHCANRLGGASHGPEFTRIHLELVKRWMGKEHADKLKANFKVKKVKVGRKVIEVRSRPPVLKPVTLKDRYDGTMMGYLKQKELADKATKLKRTHTYLQREIAKGQDADLRKIADWCRELETAQEQIRMQVQTHINHHQLQAASVRN